MFSMTQWSFGSMFFIFQVVMRHHCFCWFPAALLYDLTIYVGMVEILSNSLKFDSWPNMWSVLENTSCVDVYSVAVGQSFLKTSVRFLCLVMSFISDVSLLIFCQNCLSSDENGLLKSSRVDHRLLYSWLDFFPFKILHISSTFFWPLRSLMVLQLIFLYV